MGKLVLRTPNIIYIFSSIKRSFKASKIYNEKFNLKKGDRVIIYMTNIPEALF